MKTTEAQDHKLWWDYWSQCSFLPIWSLLWGLGCSSHFRRWEAELHKVHASVQIPLEVSAHQSQDCGLALFCSLFLFFTMVALCVFKCLGSAWRGWPVSWQKLSELRCQSSKEVPQFPTHAARWMADSWNSTGWNMLCLKISVFVEVPLGGVKSHFMWCVCMCVSFCENRL